MAAARFAFLDHDGPIAFAHRGGALEAPENTWASFEHARRLGYTYLETDVRLTADGVVVAFHDADLARVAGRPEAIGSMTWSALRDVAVVGGADDDRVPRLDELLAAWPDARWNIDAKDDEVAGPLIETLRRSGAIDRVCVTAFDDRRLGRIRRAIGPGLCTAMGPAGVAALRIDSWLPSALASAAAAPLRRFGAAQVPPAQGRLRLVDRRLVDAAHRIGLHVHVWTIDDEPTIERLLDLGVDGIMTDRPTVLRDVLRRRGAWP